MNTNNIKRFLFLAGLSVAVLVLGTSKGNAHCDTMDGPVVKAAQKALETGNVNLVLIWVQKNDEAEIRRVFEKTLAVRKLGPEAKQLADMYFFETLVRVHRAGEGAPYTGLKPAGSEIDSGIEMADKAIEKGSAEELVRNLNEVMHEKLHMLFTDVKGKRNFKTEDIEAGRDFVKAYVTFIHYVEKLYVAAGNPPEEHGKAVGGEHQH